MIGLAKVSLDMEKIYQWLVAGFIAGAVGNVWALDDMHWYKNEIRCAEVKITVYSECQNAPDLAKNTACFNQKIEFNHPDGRQYKKNRLLEREPVRGNYHALSSIRCAAETEGEPYLYMILDNGGNCDDCEIDAVMNLRGQWMRYDRKWLTQGGVRRDIAMRQDDWFKMEAVYLKNKIKAQVGP